MTQTIFKDWQPRHSDLFGQHTLLLQHSLAETGLFTEDALADLIDRYPSALYNLSSMGKDPQRNDWREGDLAETSGKEVINAIKNGRLWLNLRHVMDVDEQYAKLLSDIFSEVEGHIPGLKTFKHNLGILISSPGAQVFYHADIPGQSLWQLAGRKRIYVYPNQKPFLQPEALEAMIMGETEEDIHFENWFDDYAEIYDLEPGQMATWALNGPHRVVNEDCLNISVTTEHWTDEIRRSYAVNYANGVLRRVFGYQPVSQSTNGLSVYPKAAIALLWKSLKLRRAHHFVHTIDFKLDPTTPGRIVDIPAMAKV